MANKRNKVNNKNKINEMAINKSKENIEKIVYWILVFLVFSIPICWLFSGRGTQNITVGDNYVTATLQNYNYLLGSVALFSVIMYLYSKIKENLSKKLFTDSMILGYGFGGVAIILIAIVTVLSFFSPINSYILGKGNDGKLVGYGLNSTFTVSIFLIFVTITAILAITYGIMKLVELIKNKNICRTLLKYSPIILLIAFIIWTFISCLLAPGAVNTAKDIGISSEEILSKTFNGCYNLKDGFWAFLMYGSIFLVAMLISSKDSKKRLIKGFVLVITFVSILTLSMYVYSNDVLEQEKIEYSEFLQSSGDEEPKLTMNQLKLIVKNKVNPTYVSLGLYPVASADYVPVYNTSGIFRNSNHFAYVLCMAVVASAVLAFIEKKWWQKLIYILTFTITLTMLIINNTFGAYLGVCVALLFFLMYAIIKIIKMFIKNENNQMNLSNKITTILATIILVMIFFTATFTIKSENGVVIATENINKFLNDFNIFTNFVGSQEDITDVDISEVDNSVASAGSQRGKTWIKVWELIKQRPIFGYGLECLLFQFNGQFGINEGRTHNLLLQLLATVGIPGTIMYFLALAIIFIRLVKNWKTWDDIEKICVFVGISYMVTALTGNSTFYTSPYFMMFLGFVALTPWKREKSEKI